MTYPISLNLSQKQAPSLKQMQRLIMSPQMQQALNLLQLPILELSAVIEKEIEENPILERSTDEEQQDEDFQQIVSETTEELAENVEVSTEQELKFDDQDFEIMRRLDEDFREYFSDSASYASPHDTEDEKLTLFLESSIRSQSTLFEYLMGQASQTFSTEGDLKIAEALIGNLDEKGLLQPSLDEIALLNDFDVNEVKKVLIEIQNFDPPGIGAQNLQEALLIQLRNRGKKKSLAYQILERHFQDLLHNRILQIQKKLKCSIKEIRDAIQHDIAKLDLHPGTRFSREVVQPIVPDVKIEEDNGQLKIVVNDDFLPSFHLNKRYLKLLDDETLPLETRDFIKQKFFSAKWLMRNIFQRSETIEKIAVFLAEKQSDFMLNPKGKLVPMTMKLVAQELNLHESTIARAVSNKYLSCPQGILSLKSFFTVGYATEIGEDISSQTVREALFEIISKENKKHPLSDAAISSALKAQGIDCARRTVAKYRNSFGIEKARQRKTF
jgi:RNA polymerase sigma-54 factor